MCAFYLMYVQHHRLTTLPHVVVQSGDRCKATNCRESNHSNEILVRVSSVDAWRWKGKHSMAHLVNSLSYISGADKLTEKYLDSATQTDWRHVIIYTTISGRFWLHHFFPLIRPSAFVFLSDASLFIGKHLTKWRENTENGTKQDRFMSERNICFLQCVRALVRSPPRLCPRSFLRFVHVIWEN